MSTSTPAATTAPSPAIGIQPYIDQSVARIRRYFTNRAQPHSPTADALVIGVFGEWGSGKSFLLEAVGKHFPNTPPAFHIDEQANAISYAEQTLTIAFNPWRYEREPHLLIPLFKTVQSVLLKFLSDCRVEYGKTETFLEQGEKAVAALGWLKNRTVRVAESLIALTKMVEIKAGIPSLGEIKIDPYAGLKAAQEVLDRADKLEAAGDKKKEPDWDSLYYDLHHTLREITRGDPAGALGAGHLNFLFLIDDLDRCLPDKAVEMLESIKLFLDVPGCAFVLAVDDEVVERGIAHRYRDYLNLTDYGSESIAYALKPQRFEEYRSRHGSHRLPPITGHEYLEKIVQLPFRLPRWSETEVRNFLRQKYPDLFALPAVEHTPGREKDDGNPPSSSPPPSRSILLELFVQAIPPVPRKLIRAAELFAFTRDIARERGLTLDDYTLAQLVLLQLFAPACFRFLRQGRQRGLASLGQRIETLQTASLIEPRDHLGKPLPGLYTPSFFTWWENKCRNEADSDPTDAPYLEEIELPFITQVRQASHNRSGFDPRALFLEWQPVDEKLARYFSLFDDTPPPPSLRPTVPCGQRPSSETPPLS